ncbi:DUF1190 domain-containing protein [Paracoccus sp. S-4012]|uniref:DUF1190 domain-containing protein n=1 Tax=Paracoccus sp. S-4012 TaxID=2665648 RepID=UPI0012AF2DE9|nr:DUF1190 domain-containing protein [Paracoccus sp. S-4012]MRX51958.1 DUF1190 domain-containing protein [Paracoccus sp. S-4012]
MKDTLTDAQATPRPRKRSRHVALFLAGAAVFTLAGCEEKVDAAAFPDLESCLAEAETGSLFFTADDCRTTFAEAQAAWEETAPRYESLELCEQEHGVGNCGGDPVAQQQGGGGFSFMPLLMGYMIGSMMGRGGGVFSQPMVRTGDGRFSNPAGSQTFATNRGAGQVAPATFNRGPSTLGRPPMSAAQVAQRGGFGSSSTRATGAARGAGG